MKNNRSKFETLFSLQLNIYLDINPYNKRKTEEVMQKEFGEVKFDDLKNEELSRHVEKNKEILA